MLQGFFKAKKIALIGVSRNPNKIGYAIFKNLLESRFNGEIFIVNPHKEPILGRIPYQNVGKIKEKIDMAVIMVPSKALIQVIEECGKKQIRNVVIITSGFSETGNYKLNDLLKKTLKKYKIKAIGPNCLGILDTKTGLDAIFNPKDRMKRPRNGGIAFVSQSGAVGSVILDMGAEQGYGFSKFISYGNAINIDETDIIEYLDKDQETDVICLYVEWIRDGKKFIDIASKLKKPIIAIKGGVTEEGSKATLSHTGALGGSGEIYKGAFKQAGIINVDTLEEMFGVARVISSYKKINGKRIQVITNGGGLGIICTDEVAKNNLELSKLTNTTKKELEKKLLAIASVGNPLDLSGGSTLGDYENSLHILSKDNNVDLIIVIILPQVPGFTNEFIDMLGNYKEQNKKPIVAIMTGSDLSNFAKRSLEERGVPVFDFPNQAVISIKKVIQTYSK